MVNYMYLSLLLHRKKSLMRCHFYCKSYYTGHISVFPTQFLAPGPLGRINEQEYFHICLRGFKVPKNMGFGLNLNTYQSDKNPKKGILAVFVLDL